MAKVFKSKEHGYVCELWGASTKHPDSVFYFDNFKKVDVFPDEEQVFQWLLECASKLTWPVHAKELVEYAIEKWYPAMGWKEPELEEYNRSHWYR